MRVETILKESCNFQKAAEVIGEHNFLPTLCQTHVLPTVDLPKNNDILSIQYSVFVPNVTVNRLFLSKIISV